MEPRANALIEGLAIWTIRLGQLREWKDKLMRDQESFNIEEALFPCQTQQAEPLLSSVHLISPQPKMHLYRCVQGS